MNKRLFLLFLAMPFFGAHINAMLDTKIETYKNSKSNIQQKINNIKS